MKPPEILGLLEEAAGTKMYEDKKRKAVATLEKKQLKVDEINKVCARVGVGGGGEGEGEGWLSGGRAAAKLVWCGQQGRQRSPVMLRHPPQPSHPTLPCSLQVLTEDILPALDKLRQEKVQYMQWQNANKSQEKLMRFCIAYRYLQAEL